MTAKPTYEEIEKLADALTQEIATCRNLQRHLHQAEQTARALLNATTDSAILIDTKGKILAINEIAVKRLTKNNVDMMRKNLLDILPPTLAQQRKFRIDQVLDTGDPLQFEDAYAGAFFLILSIRSLTDKEKFKALPISAVILPHSGKLNRN